jgi:uncharacterized membrane protein
LRVVTRTVLWLLAGVVLGGVIHLAVILSLPSLAANAAWAHRLSMRWAGRWCFHRSPRRPNALHLDPELAYAVCRMDLRQGPVSSAVCCRSPSGRSPSMGAPAPSSIPPPIAMHRPEPRTGHLQPGSNAAPGQQQLDIAEGLLIVESRDDDVFVVIRLAPPHQAMRKRYEAALQKISCGTIPA